MKIPFRITCASIVLMAGAAMVGPSAATAQIPPLPTSMAAIGDSFTVGFSTGAPDCAGACPQWSWSTGTSSTSHYACLLGLSPGIAGHAINAAQPGASMSGFVGQVGTATAGGNQPDYVTVLLGGADTCLFSAPTDVSVFSAQFRAGMDALFQASPNSRVLVASILNLESLRSAVLADNPSATFALCGSTFFNASDAARAAIMDRVQQFNAVLSTECATYANCEYDGGAFFAHQWTRAEVSTVDNVHPSVAGQNMISATLWNAGFWPNTCGPLATTTTTSSTSTTSTTLVDAADQTVLGKQVQVKDPKPGVDPAKRKIVVQAKESGSTNTIVGDPVANGATLTVFTEGSTSANQVFALSAGTDPESGKAFWAASGTGYTYKDKGGANGPVKVAQIKKSSSGTFEIKAVALGKNGSITLLPPNLGSSACVVLAIGDGDSYHVRLAADSTIKKNDDKTFLIKAPLTEGLCAAP